jgi:hypothetical protein
VWRPCREAVDVVAKELEGEATDAIFGIPVGDGWVRKGGVEEVDDVLGAHLQYL